MKKPAFQTILALGFCFVCALFFLFLFPQKSPTGVPKPSSSHSSVELAPAPFEESITVYVTESGNKYHREGCQYLAHSKIPLDLQKARQTYQPCSTCKPPA